MFTAGYLQRVLNLRNELRIDKQFTADYYPWSHRGVSPANASTFLGLKHRTTHDTHIKRKVHSTPMTNAHFQFHPLISHRPHAIIASKQPFSCLVSSGGRPITVVSSHCVGGFRANACIYDSTGDFLLDGDRMRRQGCCVLMFRDVLRRHV